MTTHILADKGLTDFVNSIDSWPKAMVAIVVVIAITVVVVAFFVGLFS